mmetsp:Transcript_8062/g.9090  ORF Transcript_8062/g.9090 Transcript_8062/m.9090 type:complete len:363 (+) Transcript_8062:31-1119(+)
MSESSEQTKHIVEGEPMQTLPPIQTEAEQATTLNPPASEATRHFRQKKVWSAEDSKAFWKEKKQAKKSRQRENHLKKKDEQQRAWELLSEAEREEIRQKAAHVHELRRAQIERHEATCVSNLNSADTPTLIFDLGFTDVMSAADCRSTVSQIKFSYSILKRGGFCMKPVMTSFDSTHPVLGCLSTFEGFKKFPFPILSDHWSTPSESSKEAVSQLGNSSKLVYLTADTDTILDSLEPGTAYIVGAFVDHNSKKGLTRDVAAAHGIRTARLPLVESIRVGNRCKVFTINHVVDILVTFMETHDWAAAFEAALPTRRLQAEDDSKLTSAQTPDEDADGAAEEVEREEEGEGDEEIEREKRPRSP